MAQRENGAEIGAGKTQLEILKDRLFGDPDFRTTNINIFPGTKPATPEQIAGEINKAMDQIAAGDFELVEDFDEDIEQIKVSELIAGIVK